MAALFTYVPPACFFMSLNDICPYIASCYIRIQSLLSSEFSEAKSLAANLSVSCDVYFAPTPLHYLLPAHTLVIVILSCNLKHGTKMGINSQSTGSNHNPVAH